MKKLVFITFLFAAMSTHAQEVGFWNKVNAFLTKPAVVDTAFVYQPKAGFSLGLFSTGQKTGFDVDVNFKVAASLTWNRFFFSTQFTYNRFYFRSRDAVDVSQLNVPDYVDDIGFRGIFHDWMLKGLLVYRF